MAPGTTTSAALLVWRRDADAVRVLVAHMGGPLWARRDAGAWSLPKGEVEPGEEPLAAALREFAEELGVAPPRSAPVLLGTVRQRSGKRVVVFAVEGDLDPSAIRPGTFAMEWPPRSGRTAEFPEIDRVAWLLPDEARPLLVRGQEEALGWLEALVGVVDHEGSDPF